MDAILPYGTGKTLIELKIGDKPEQAARQLCVYEAQRLKLQSLEKREQYRSRDTFCVYAFPGFAQDLTYIRIRRIHFEFLEDHPSIAHIFCPIRFRVLAGDEIDFQNLWQLNCVWKKSFETLLLSFLFEIAF
eukprot:Gregarina_sp_Poly_1__4375@NODE_2366_length_2224_cov_99_817339_g1210_i1_p2_GENE_NODE_2366_length_2224_cov_99_817339_g1210_i1NODE_2366_length_2224_cov_99_817339_g1210_i1_p2_ORF_typecomplete_len132_score9_18_NODE_2366_length_2224_cov_99_817339_g1210_i16351030